MKKGGYTLDRKEIGIKLMELRGEKTQKEVASDLGISISALGMYEKGHRIPRDEIKIKLAKYYGKSIQAIFFTGDCHEKGQKDAMKQFEGREDEEDT